MTFAEYTKHILKDVDAGGEGFNTLRGALSLSGAAGAVAELIKRKRFYGKTVGTERVKEALGDVLRELVYMCEAEGSTLEDVAKYNTNKQKGTGDFQ